ncbi:MAG: hypothetical protein AAF849_07905 [Bacteroidota bacterium]
MKYSILEMAEEKAFAALDASQKEQVLQYMTMAEYEQLHQSLQKSIQFFQTEERRAPSHLQKNLLAQFRQKQHRQASISSSIQRRIPAWAAIAACICIGILSWVISRKDSYGASAPRTIYVHQIDTIYKEVEKALGKNDLLAFDSSQFFQQDQVMSTKSYQQKNNLPTQSSNFQDKDTSNEAFPPARIHPLFLQERAGQSVQDDTLLAGLGGRIF